LPKNKPEGSLEEGWSCGSFSAKKPTDRESGRKRRRGKKYIMLYLFRLSLEEKCRESIGEKIAPRHVGGKKEVKWGGHRTTREE